MLWELLNLQAQLYLTADVLFTQMMGCIARADLRMWEVLCAELWSDNHEDAAWRTGKQAEMLCAAI